MGNKFCVVCLTELDSDLLRTFLLFQIDFDDFKDCTAVYVTFMSYD